VFSETIKRAFALLAIAIMLGMAVLLAAASLFPAEGSFDVAAAAIVLGAAIPTGAYTIREFCLGHRISEVMFFKMQSLGLAPDTMSVGRRKLISIESAARWRAAREAAAREEQREAGAEQRKPAEREEI
jgi:hypothetical protein